MGRTDHLVDTLSSLNHLKPSQKLSKIIFAAESYLKMNVLRDDLRIMQNDCAKAISANPAMGAVTDLNRESASFAVYALAVVNYYHFSSAVRHYNFNIPRAH